MSCNMDHTNIRYVTNFNPGPNRKSRPWWHNVCMVLGRNRFRIKVSSVPLTRLSRWLKLVSSEVFSFNWDEPDGQREEFKDKCGGPAHWLLHRKLFWPAKRGWSPERRRCLSGQGDDGLRIPERNPYCISLFTLSWLNTFQSVIIVNICEKFW